ncbi:MAG: transketolase, partial [Bacteroidetes bacterium]|nr:transketolase [Bacteroidota bacterium]
MLPSKDEILNDFKIVCESRQASLLGRKEVLNGKAKFGIFGDGKELPQIAMAKVFQDGDWRSGYYRDQTFMIASGMYSIQEFFAQLYGDTDLKANPGNGGRLMNNHFATRSLDGLGNWKNLTKQKNTSSDISPTAGQMPRLLGLALASKLFRNNSKLKDFSNFSVSGNEVAFGTIGDASTSEGHFFETINAAGVLKVPMAMSIWDDGWGISVSKKYQTTKQSISEILKGFELNEKEEGYLILTAKGWNYPELIEIYKKGISICREKHIPVIFHITELTQPQGHSTSGSQERYKTKEELDWEKEYDCNLQFRKWILENKFATEEELISIENSAIETVKNSKKLAWENFQNPIKQKRDELVALGNVKSCHCAKSNKIENYLGELAKIKEPIRKDYISTAKKILRLYCKTCSSEKSLKKNLLIWLNNEINDDIERYSSHLYSESENSGLKINEVKVKYNEDSKLVNGREIILANYDYILENNPLTVVFGEDVGKIGGVNQTLEGMQEKFGEIRVFDTGIREATIIGQGIGLAIRGIRPIAEIQYFDYLLYAIQIMSDDLSTLQYRTKGGQKAPLIISTRGHRLEGIWHSGSPLSMVINSIRGVNVCVPRNMTQAAGFYNTALLSDDPFLIIEPLNAYRLKEKMPANIGQFTAPIGIPEILES